MNRMYCIAGLELGRCLGLGMDTIAIWQDKLIERNIKPSIKLIARIFESTNVFEA